MYRRVVSLLLLPCLLLTQSAAFGHSHGGSQPAGHDLRPHIHTTSATAGHQQDHDRHHQGHGGGGHHHDADDATSDAPTSLTSPQPEPLPDHDSDAIYINAADAVAVERSKPASEIAPSLWWTAADADLFAKGWADPPTHSVFCGHPPPLYGNICPLYIRHLALLI